MDERVPQLLDAALTHKARRRANFGRDDQRRLSLVCALLQGSPRLSAGWTIHGLDPPARRLMWLVAAAAPLNPARMPSILRPRFMDEAERLCSRASLVQLDHGKKIAEQGARAHRPAPGKRRGRSHRRGAPGAPPEDIPGPLATRVEISGETVLHTRTPQPQLYARHPLGRQHRRQPLHRPSNLGDLFLKLTGGRFGSAGRQRGVWMCRASTQGPSK